MPRSTGIFALLLLAACAGGATRLPYPAFMQVDELEDVFLASMPGVRAKPLAGDAQTRRTSNRVDLPADWRGTSGGTPGRSMELFVLAGTLMLSDIELAPGGYAFLPGGSLGFNMATKNGARILYFVNDADPESVIRSPIIINADLREWQPTTTRGVTTKELRRDPGSGARTWLMRVEPGTTLPWQSSAAPREGYLVTGKYRQNECVAGKVHSGQYAAGGYFQRPSNAISGGPGSGGDGIWFLREPRDGEHEILPDCRAISSPTR